jgi:hypothetical protein
MILCFALGIANCFDFGHVLLIIFAALCMYDPSAQPNPMIRLHANKFGSATAFIILFIEVPFLLRICPTSDKFDSFIRRFSTNYMRAIIYLIMSIVQWLSWIIHSSTLIVAAVVLLITASFYGIAALRKDEFMSSKTLGGAGVAQMIV